MCGAVYSRGLYSFGHHSHTSANLVCTYTHYIFFLVNAFIRTYTTTHSHASELSGECTHECAYLYIQHQRTICTYSAQDMQTCARACTHSTLMPPPIHTHWCLSPLTHNDSSKFSVSIVLCAKAQACTLTTTCTHHVYSWPFTLQPGLMASGLCSLQKNLLYV